MQYLCSMCSTSVILTLHRHILQTLPIDSDSFAITRKYNEMKKAITLNLRVDETYVVIQHQNLISSRPTVLISNK